MVVREYRLAQRRGLSQYESDIAKGVYPYLQVLEELTQNLDIVSEVPLGIVDIPIAQIVGTNGHGRSTSFARNFMPLLREDSEFADKWSNLCIAHLEEGIRDPIKCYEFMNRFYVIEGNKRVSVLKYYDAIEIQGEVTRIVPRLDDSKASKVYRDFLRFYKIARVNYVNFSEPGSYDLLLEYLDKPKKEDWNTEFQKRFRSVYYRFVNLYRKSAGKKIALSESDAFLEYLKIYSFDSINESTDKQIAAAIQTIESNLNLAAQETPVGLHMQPEDKKKNLVEKLASGIGEVLGVPEKHLNVAFVYGKTPETSGWTYGHEPGRLQLEEVMGEDISVTKVEDALNQSADPDEILSSLAEAGNDVVFTTTPELITQTIRAAVKYPKTKFLNCSVNMAAGKIRTYYGRMYEAKFLTGLIAGVMTKSNRIAYIADYAISGMMAGVNAFARGVQLVNPEAKVKLIWSSLVTSDVEGELAAYDPDVVSHQDFITPISKERHYGLYFRSENGETKELAMPLWNWGLFYERIIKSIQSGAWYEDNSEEVTHSINYWWGLSSGVIDIVLSGDLPEGVRQLVSFYKKAIERRSYSPFDGCIKDQSGKVRSEADGYISTAHIVTMDWLIDNIEGEIPSTEQFREGAQNLMKNMDLTKGESEEVEELE